MAKHILLVVFHVFVKPPFGKCTAKLPKPLGERSTLNSHSNEARTQNPVWVCKFQLNCPDFAVSPLLPQRTPWIYRHYLGEKLRGVIEICCFQKLKEQDAYPSFPEVILCACRTADISIPAPSHPSPISTTAEKGELFPFGATSGQQNTLNGLPNSRFSQEIDALGSRLIYNISA